MSPRRIVFLIIIVIALGYFSIKLDGLEVQGFVWRFIHGLWIVPFATIWIIIAILIVALKWFLAFLF